MTDPREHLVRALKADLIGPFDLDNPNAVEELKLAPSRWYLTGFLAPQEGREVDADPTDDEGFGAGDDEDEEDTQAEEPESGRKHWLPASMGLTVLLPPRGAETIRAAVRWAEYKAEEREGEAGQKKVRVWKRVPVPQVTEELRINGELLGEDGVLVTNTSGVRLIGRLETVPAMSGLEEGTRALSVFVVNRRGEGEFGKRDEQFMFQVELALEYADGFVARPNVAGEHMHDWDERLADLQFRDKCEFAVGHGVSVDVVAPDGDGKVRRVRTAWIPRSEVRRVITREEPGVTVHMEALALLASAAEVQQHLSALPEKYGDWIAERRQVSLRGRGRREATRDEVLEKAERARHRIARGIALLAEDTEVREAFCLANRAMALAARKRRPDSEPTWRLFQLAFVLLNLEGLADPEHDDREDVELVFFPTGGGKTEAYLGVIAFSLALRRLRGQARPDRGLGVAVILRYTLRLLTLDQLGRAASLVCALELLRRQQPERLGAVRFSVGLWVGRGATPNLIADAVKQISEYRNGTRATSPFPLTECPWCGTAIKANSFESLRSGKRADDDLMVSCTNDACEFCAAHPPGKEGLPVLFVDEQVYRELPCFLIATVDKFAMLPWRGETALLFGKATHCEGRRVYGPLDKPPLSAVRLPDGLLPPDLIVQDELHLISGPLGTMVGLYETVIDALSTREGQGGSKIRPKVLAATATVQRAATQIQALFERDASRVNLFPPQGIDDSETYFAEVDQRSPGRLYIGVAAQGKAMRRVLSRVYSTLLGAAARIYDGKGDPEQVADGYMTLAGYFNSLRELGGMQRITHDEVLARLERIDERRPLNAVGEHPWLKRRSFGIDQVVELTSRVNTGAISSSKARLKRPYADKEARVDVLLASNMISVGVDIDRLGLMVVAGQPKTTAEYIQASSRVGRQTNWPGLVVTCLNLHKPRDRSHYERFAAYHQSFYRFVEATTVTPFSGPAIDRGLSAALVALTRLSDFDLVTPRGAMAWPRKKSVGERAVSIIAQRGAKQPGLDERSARELREKLEARATNLLHAWESLVDTTGENPAKRSYSPWEDRSAGRPILFSVLDEDQPNRDSTDAKFAAPTSMRDVESSVHLWVVGRKLGGRKS